MLRTFYFFRHTGFYLGHREVFLNRHFLGYLDDGFLAESTPEITTSGYFAVFLRNIGRSYVDVHTSVSNFRSTVMPADAHATALSGHHPRPEGKGDMGEG